MKQIVILGAGFGGLRTAMVLGKKMPRKLLREFRIILIDKNDYHTYTPTLYEAATTSKETANYVDLKKIVTFPVERIISGLPVEFLKKEIKSIDAVKGRIIFSNGGHLDCDYLVIALGSEISDFGIAGIKEHALQLKSFNDALRARDAVIAKFEENRSKRLKIIIGGGGSTGVELAGELRVWLCAFEKAMRCEADVMIVEGNPTILFGFHEAVIKKAERRVKKLGVKIIAGSYIEKVEQGGVFIKNGEKLDCDIFIWAGGVRAPALVSALPFETEKSGRIRVAGKMECLPETPDLKLNAKIYGLGDSVCFYDAAGEPVPGVARAAIIQGSIVAHNIIEDIKYSEQRTATAHHRIYKPMRYPYIIPIGGKWALAKIGPVIVSGFWGWVLKGLVELNYLLSIMKPLRAIRVWLAGLKIFIQNDRLG